MSGSQKKKNWEMKEKKATDAGLLNILEAPSAREHCNNVSLSLCLHLRNYNQQSQRDPQCLQTKAPIVQPDSHSRVELIQHCKNGCLTEPDG